MKKKLRLSIQALARDLLADEKLGDVKQLKETAARLHEQLTVLHFLETKLMEDEEEISVDQSMDSKSFREQNWFREPEPVPAPEHSEEIIEPVMEKIKDLVAQMPQEGEQVDELLKEILPQARLMKNDKDDLEQNYRETPVFERKSTSTRQVEDQDEVAVTTSSPSSKSLNEKLHRGLQIGLNDRLAFIKHLFDGNTEDYKRVLSQISTLGSFQEAKAFIRGKVKPEYNYWLKKEVYADRFMTIVERSFE
jgi:hypothetical protein